jgi:hypothetical protein
MNFTNGHGEVISRPLSQPSDCDREYRDALYQLPFYR